MKAFKTKSTPFVVFDVWAVPDRDEVLIEFSNRAMDFCIALHPNDADTLRQEIADALARIIDHQECAEQQLINFIPDEA